MNAHQNNLKFTQKSDIIVFFLATLIIGTLMGKGIVSLSDTENGTALHTMKK
jgi:hypothetical protein